MKTDAGAASTIARAAVAPIYRPTATVLAAVAANVARRWMQPHVRLGLRQREGGHIPVACLADKLVMTVIPVTLATVVVFDANDRAGAADGWGAYLATLAGANTTCLKNTDILSGRNPSFVAALETLGVGVESHARAEAVILVVIRCIPDAMLGSRRTLSYGHLSYQKNHHHVKTT